MRAINYTIILIASLACAGGLRAQTGPFSPEDWPGTKRADKKVHYVSADPNQDFAPVSASWLADELRILSGGDQATTPITIGGHTGLKVTGLALNIADSTFTEWADDDVIDILMQVYGDAALFAANGKPRNFTFLTGAVPELNFPVGGSLPVEAKNKQWNWVLFRIVNGKRPSDGLHYVGSAPAPGGVNGGTIRMESVASLIVRVVAFGEQGAFGEPDQVNVFAAGETCGREPETNVVFADISLNTNSHLEVLNNGDQTVTFQDNVGPAGDKRRAVKANGNYLNFGVTDNYLGEPCNDPRAVKICVEFFDDPALSGTVFGPEAYATDDKGSIGTYPADQRHVLAGSGQWVRRSFTIPAVNLKGVNTAPLTGGPRLIFEGEKVFIARFTLGVFRTGTNSLAGLDPIPDCFEDDNICKDVYGSFAELDLAKGTKNGLDVGSSGGDQFMVVEEAGPANDRRLAVRPDGVPGVVLNFAIIANALGPSTQDNARLAICVTYYDDPALTGGSFRPEVYQTDIGGQIALAFTPGNIAVPLEGTDTWKDAYFELPNVKFNGVNQGPQAAARFQLSKPIFFTRLRYAVIRPCGPKAGINLLEACKPDVSLGIGRSVNDTVRLAWPTSKTGFVLQEADTLTSPQWKAVTTAPVVDGNENVVTQPITGTRYYRLTK